MAENQVGTPFTEDGQGSAGAEMAAAPGRDSIRERNRLAVRWLVHLVQEGQVIAAVVQGVQDDVQVRFQTSHLLQPTVGNDNPHEKPW
jgi:hypothetical protein